MEPGSGHSGPKIVEFAEADVPAVVDLCRSALDLPEDAAEAAAIVARLWDGDARPGPRPPRHTAGLIATANGSVVGAVRGSIGHADPTVGHVDLIAVEPRHRRQGVGRALLGRVERALAVLGAQEIRFVGNAPHYAWPGVDVRYTPAVCLATALGYERYDTAWNMTADLSDSSPAVADTVGEERRLAAQGIEVRRASADDLSALVEFAAVNFGGVWDAEITDSISNDDGGCHLAVRGTEVLGFAAYGSSRPSMFGPMGTVPAARGLGIGGILLRRCLRDQRTLGHRQAQIGWAGPVRFYSGTIGARIERVFLLFRKPL